MYRAENPATANLSCRSWSVASVSASTVAAEEEDEYEEAEEEEDDNEEEDALAGNSKTDLTEDQNVPSWQHI
jgi:hypothetical protein